MPQNQKPLRGKDKNIIPGNGTAGSFVAQEHAPIDDDARPQPAAEWVPAYGSHEEAVRDTFEDVPDRMKWGTAADYRFAVNEFDAAMWRAGLDKTDAFDFHAEYSSDMVQRVQHSVALSSARTAAEIREREARERIEQAERDVEEAIHDQTAFLILFREPRAAAIRCEIVDLGKAVTVVPLEILDRDGNTLPETENWSDMRQAISNTYRDSTLPKSARWSGDRHGSELTFTF
ncbi:hypothetical protein [Leifsonia sp. Leaf264]|uniref:hypothetical protein n=1 Tax=Leifsonia sp. Leaf264 TaxID=1736314 RepID=UPI0006F9C357|nr:hypothetical protein [Leifsonia sp. Leaf264]KQO98691.1 hypothetical protein ASF30_11555 [Leifsonia sp. Leaf264]